MPGNYQPAQVPGTGDTLEFNSSGDNPCTFTANMLHGGLATILGYTSKVDLAIYDLTGDDGADVILDGEGEWDQGTGTVSITNGTFDWEHVGVATRGASTTECNGVCTLRGASNRDMLHNVTFASESNVSIPAKIDICGLWDIYGSCDVSVQVALTGPSADMHLQAGSSIVGASLVYDSLGSGARGLSIFHATATCDIPILIGWSSSTNVYVAGNYQQAIKVTSFGSVAWKMSTGTYTLASLELESSAASGTLTLDTATNSPAVTVQSDLRIDLNSTGNITIDGAGGSADWDIQGDVVDERTGGGTFTWNKGIGDYQATGSADQDWDLMNQPIGDFEVNKSAGTLTFSGPWTADSFLHTAGTIDPNGQTMETIGDFTIAGGFAKVGVDTWNGATLTVGGNFNAAGSAGRLLSLKATSEWTLAVTGTAVADLVKVSYSNATLTAVTATNYRDFGNTTNWIFSGDAMSKELGIHLPTGQTIKAIVWGEDRSTRWNGSDMVDPDTILDAAWATGMIACAEELTASTTGTGTYTGDFPVGITTVGEYAIEYFVGASPTPGQIAVGIQTVEWSGTAIANMDVTVDAIWDELLTGATHNIATSAGRRLRDIASQIIGTFDVVSATANTVTLDASASVMDGAYDPSQILVTEGTGAGQVRGIIEYFGSAGNGNAAKTAILDRDWKVTPDGTSKIVVIAQDGRASTNEGQLRGGSTTTATLNALAPGADIAGLTLQFLSGTGQDQAALIISYAQPIATFSALDVAVDAFTGYQLLPTGKVCLEAINNDLQSVIDLKDFADDGYNPATNEVQVDVLAQVNAALDTAIAELGVALPTATPSVRTALMLMYMTLRNRLDVPTSGTDSLQIRNDAGTIIAEKLLTDDGDDYTEAKMISG